MHPPTSTDRKQKGHYTSADIDVLVAYILPLDLWYAVPANAFRASASLRFYPQDRRFEQNREAWELFRQQPLSDLRDGSAPPSNRPLPT